MFPSLLWVYRKTHKSTARFILFFLFVMVSRTPSYSQNYMLRSFGYNSLVGGFSGGVGAVINKHKGQKWYKAFAKGFVIGLGGGMVEFGGKRMNALVAQKHELGYAWLSRAVFSAGNSVVENAAANRDFWSVWHYDVSFVRLEFNTKERSLTPRLMPSMFFSTVYLSVNGRLNLEKSLQSGTAIFYTRKVPYADRFVASTPSNGLFFVDTLRRGTVFYETFAHEMVHTFQFQEFSGFNYFFKKKTDHWEEKYPRYRKLHKYIYGDLNYELMVFNYFLVFKGITPDDYCDNFLENEAEFLTTGRPACRMVFIH
jgi:hypothetical protein